MLSPPDKEEPVEHINIINNLGQQSAELSGYRCSRLRLVTNWTSPVKALCEIKLLL